MDKHTNNKEMKHLCSILFMLKDTLAELPETMETEAEKAVKENMASLKSSLETLFSEKRMDTLPGNSTFYSWCIGYTNPEDIEAARMEGTDVVSAIQTHCLTDDEDDSDKLLAAYQEATATERAIMDQVLACICGWTMGSILKYR